MVALARVTPLGYEFSFTIINRFIVVAVVVIFFCLPIETHWKLLTSIAFPDSWTMANRMSPTIKQAT